MHTHVNHRPLARALSAAGLGLVLAVGLAACGNDTPGNDASGTTTAPASTTEHNDADVTFASDMIQHHAQALLMVDLTLDRQLDPEVQALAEEIRAAQAPEIETMTNWLTSWGEEVPATMRDHANADEGMDGMAGMDHGSSDMPGMMTAEDMSALESASDAEFQDMWLQMMMEHHQGAVEMAQAEQYGGQYQDAIDLAGQILDTQTAEIETIKGILGS